MTRLEDFKNEVWEEMYLVDGNEVLCEFEQVVGQSGVYLIITDCETGEVYRDDRPWQMTV